MELLRPPRGDLTFDAAFPFVPYHGDSIQPHCDARMVWLYYANEGGANVLYRVWYTDDRGHHEEDVRLLRLRKDKPDLPSCTENFTFYKARICPGTNERGWLFPRHWLVQQWLYPQELPADLADKLNASLQRREGNGTRPAQRRGEYLAPYAQEKQALFVWNLNVDARLPGDAAFEFKPKWLVQSPSAGTGALSCRTCALKHMRHAQGATPGRGKLGTCPFKLLSPRYDVLMPALTALFPTLPQWMSPTLVQLFATQFTTAVVPLLQRLQQLQMRFGKVGLDNFEAGTDHDLPLAMTLRDCSVVMNVKFITDEHGRAVVDFTQVTVLDLDAKHATRVRCMKWANTERSLVLGGWYGGLGQGDPRLDPVYDCALYQR